MVNRRRTCEQVVATLAVHEKEITQININTNTRTLGVHVSPVLSWKTQFEKLRRKLSDSMCTLMSVNLTYQEGAMHYNLHMLSSVNYSCRITKMNQREEEELRRIYKAPMLIKLGFSINFPREIMCMSKEMLGLGLFKPSAMIAIQALRMCFGNKCVK